jgi:glyoxylase-like metal-dependent hydrolase (beta-lactamase superfamily II)
MLGTQLVLPEGHSFDGRSLRIAGRRLRITEGPDGTVPGNLVILDESTGVAFVGALLSVHRIPGVQDTTPQKWRGALKFLDTPAIHQVVPAFGPVLRQREDVRAATAALSRYFVALDEQARALYASQKKLSELEALSELPAFKDWDNYGDNHSRNVFYRYLQIESEELLSP